MMTSLKYTPPLSSQASFPSTFFILGFDFSIEEGSLKQNIFG